MININKDGCFFSGEMVDTRPMYQTLLLAGGNYTPEHESAYLYAELQRAVSDLKERAAWFEDELRKRGKWIEGEKKTDGP